MVPKKVRYGPETSMPWVQEYSGPRNFEENSEDPIASRDRLRTYLEAEYDLKALSMDEQRAELVPRLQDAYAQWSKARKNLERFEWRKCNGYLNADDKAFGDFEFKVELKDAEERLRKVAKQLSDIERTLSQFLGDMDNDDDSLTTKIDKADEWLARNDPNAVKAQYKEFDGKFHYQGAHDAAIRKCDKIVAQLKNLSEEQAKAMLEEIDFWHQGHGRKDRPRPIPHNVGGEISGTWYYKMSMLVVKKYLDKGKVVEFLQMSDSQKRAARKKAAYFWAAAFDRLQNFRKAQTATAVKHGREWRLPTSDYSLEPKETEWDPEARMDSNPYGFCEDALIEAIDKRANWFLREAQKRASRMRKTRDKRKRFKSLLQMWKVIKALRAKEVNKCHV